MSTPNDHTPSATSGWVKVPYDSIPPTFYGPHFGKTNAEYESDLTALRARLEKCELELAESRSHLNDEIRECNQLRARLTEAEHERDVALVNEREMTEALRKQNDNYNHLTSKIDSWKDCIEAAQNRERAALAERDGADRACQKWQDSYELAVREVENLRQQVASATGDASILRSEKLQLEDARRGDFRCIVGITASNQRMAVALSDAISTFREWESDTVLVTAERLGAWKAALDSWNQYKLDHPTI